MADATFRLDRDEVLRRLRGYTHKATQARARTLTKALVFAKASIVSLSPSGASKGGLRRSWGIFTDTPRWTWGAVRSSKPYAIHVEHGTRPHWPPVAALKPWARNVLGDERLAFVVARAISIRGTRGYGMVNRTMPKIPPLLAAFGAVEIKRLEAELGDQ